APTAMPTCSAPAWPTRRRSAAGTAGRASGPSSEHANERAPPRRSPFLRSAAGSVARQPAVDVLLGVVLSFSVALLEASGEFRALALDYVEVIVGQLAPLLLNLALELLPVSFDLIPVHCRTPF